ncbi:MAG: CHASE2 domain-containing protein [Cyanobacteria bacterium P01_A01_bin.135]
MTSAASYRYQPGGSLPGSAPTYVTRQADRELLTALLEGTYCYVLNSRQMGKSSLRVRAMEELTRRGVTTVEIELLGIGSQQITAAQWYGGIIAELISGLDLEVNRRQWLQAHSDLSPVQRLGQFMETVVLTQVTQPLVIFFDEIDSVLGLDFPTDNFFGLIRSWYERRATQPLYQRLTVVMLGVATPSALMKDEQSTPFNIGRAINLQGFQPSESGPLALGLAPYAHDPCALLQAILRWTGGQPFLTQKLCWLVTQQGPAIAAGSEPAYVDWLVRSQIIRNWEAQDEPEHLRTVRDRVLRSAANPERLLRIYRRVLRRARVAATDSLEERELRLSGLVTQQRGQLVPFNRVYATIFDLSWVTQQMRRLQPPIPRLLRPACLAGAGAALLVLSLRSLGLLQGAELWAYDHMLRQQPPSPSPTEERFLVITVGEADIQYQDQLGFQRQSSLADEAMLQVLNALAPHQPRVIGMDLHHPFPFEPALAAQLSALPAFVPVCEIGQTVGVDVPVSIPAPPGFAAGALGFTDVSIDPDYRVRRQLLGMDRSEDCPTSGSFNLQVALQYLSAEGIDLEFLSDRQIRLGETTLAKLPRTAGGYQLSAAEQAGFQILADYQADDPQRVSLTQVLRREADDAIARYASDGIVLIGVENAKDSLFVPGRRRRMLGVVMQAHLARHLLDVAQGKPTRWWWPEWQEMLWIGSWGIASAVGVGIGIVRARSLWGGGAIAIGVSILLVGISYGVLTLGNGWIPIVPAVIVVGLASGAVIVFTANQHRLKRLL